MPRGLGWQSSLAASQQPPPPPQPHTGVKDETVAPDSSRLEVQLPPALRKNQNRSLQIASTGEHRRQDPRGGTSPQNEGLGTHLDI